MPSINNMFETSVVRRLLFWRSKFNKGDTVKVASKVLMAILGIGLGVSELNAAVAKSEFSNGNSPENVLDQTPNPTPPPSGTATTYGNTTYYSTGGSQTTYGNTTYYSTGGSQTTYGNSTYYSTGGSQTTYGNSTYYSTGGSQTTYGNSTYYSTGGSATTYGNTTYYSAGGSCTVYGSTTYCS